jgi:hypothetical protein
LISSLVGVDELYHTKTTTFSVNNVYRKHNENSNGSIKLWHRRLGHLGFENVLKLEKMVSRMKITHEEKPTICDPCVMSKITCTNFPAITNRPDLEVLDVVAVDVMGPITPPSEEGYKYVLVFKYIKSRCTAVYIMKRKDEVFEHVKHFKELAEN